DSRDREVDLGPGNLAYDDTYDLAIHVENRSPRVPGVNHDVELQQMEHSRLHAQRGNAAGVDADRRKLPPLDRQALAERESEGDNIGEFGELIGRIQRESSKFMLPIDLQEGEVSLLVRSDHSCTENPLLLQTG